MGTPNRISARPCRNGENTGRMFMIPCPLGALLTAADYIQAMRRRRELCSELAAIFQDVDVLVMPNHPSTAPIIADVDKSNYLIGPFRGTPVNLSGGPALSVCIGYNSEGCLSACRSLASRLTMQPCCVLGVLTIGPFLGAKDGRRSNGAMDSTIRPQF